MDKRAEGDLKNLVIGFILLAMFGVLILTAVTESGNTYSKDTSLVVGGSLSLQKFNDSISGVEQNAKNMEEIFQGKTTWSSFGLIVIEGIFGITKTMTSMILLPFNVLSNVMSDVLHIPLFVTSIILGLLILSIIFGIWSLLKIGS